MEMTIHFVLISTMCIVGLIILKRRKTEVEYTKVYLNSIYRNGPTGLILELFQNNKSIKRGLPGHLIITGIYGNVFYLSRCDNDLKISTLNNYDYKPSIDYFISRSKLTLDIFDYIYNNTKCDEYNVHWVTRYFMTCNRIYVYKRPVNVYDEICLTINNYKYTISLDDDALYISSIDYKYYIKYPQSIKNTKIRQTRSIVFGSFKSMFIRLLKYESETKIM